MDSQLRYFFHLSTAELDSLTDEDWAMKWHHLKHIRQIEAGI